MKKRLKQGFSLIEVVISMALIVLLFGVGFGACVVAAQIGKNADREEKAFNDCEKLRLSAEDAYQSIESDSDLKEAFITSFLGQLEWYFEVDGIVECVQANGFETEWQDTFSLKGDARGITFCNFGKDEYSPTHTCEIKVFGAGYYSKCALSYRMETFYVTLTAYKSTENAFYTKELSFGW